MSRGRWRICCGMWPGSGEACVWRAWCIRMARMMEHNGILVAVEGIDGAGKTTQVRMLEERLRLAGMDVVASKEPTDGKWGRKVRQSATTGRLPLEEETEAFVEDRKEHVANLVVPSLEAGK